MPRTPRRKLARGIYLDRYSLVAIVKVAGRAVEQSFPRDTPIKEITRWREMERARRLDETPTAARGTLAADAVAYLARMRKRPASWPAKRSELAAWCQRFGTRPRHRISGADVDTTIAAWLSAGVAPKTVVNRCRTLRHLYVTLADDKRARTPLDAIDLPHVPARAPEHVDATTIRGVELKLRAGDPKDRARYMVIASTGIRPSQLQRLAPADVDLERGLVAIDGGKGGRPIVHVLNRDMSAAWRAFVDAGAWGKYDTSRLAKVCRRAGWPAGVRLYNAKHSIGIELAQSGAEMRDVQSWFGHTRASTTLVYTGVPVERMRRLGASLDGRLGWAEDPEPAA